MSSLRVLTSARALISNPKNWGQHKLYDGAAYCARGAILKVLLGTIPTISADDLGICAQLTQDLPPDSKAYYLPEDRDHIKVAKYNNAVSHKEVLALFDRTIARLKRQLVIDSLVPVVAEAA